MARYAKASTQINLFTLQTAGISPTKQQHAVGYALLIIPPIFKSKCLIGICKLEKLSSRYTHDLYATNSETPCDRLMYDYLQNSKILLALKETDE